MQPDLSLPPQHTPPTEPSILEELAAFTGLLNPEIIWKKEALLDDIDEQAAQRAAAPAHPNEPTTGQL